MCVISRRERQQRLIEQLFALDNASFDALEREFWRIRDNQLRRNPGDFNAAQFDADLAESDE